MPIASVSTVVTKPSADIVLSVVIPTYNRSSVLAQTLKRLLAQSVTVEWEVVVVNNRCTDDTDAVVADVAATRPGIVRIVYEDKPGASAARNRGARSARGSVLVLIDDDIYLGAGQLRRALADHRDRPTAWIVAQILPLPEHLSTPFGAFRSASASHSLPTGGLAEMETFASGFAVIPRTALTGMGGYNERYEVAALEDADLFIRARQRGVRVLYDPALVGTHDDWAGATLRDFCRRQRIHCRSAPLLQERFGDSVHPWSALIAANRAPRPGAEPLRVILAKHVKSLLSRAVPLAVLFWTAETLERLRGFPPRLLWPLYRAAIAASMYGGYQEGERVIKGHPEKHRSGGSVAASQ